MTHLRWRKALPRPLWGKPDPLCSPQRVDIIVLVPPREALGLPSHGENDSLICFLGSLLPTMGAQPSSLSLHSRWSPSHPPQMWQGGVPGLGTAPGSTHVSAQLCCRSPCSRGAGARRAAHVTTGAWSTGHHREGRGSQGQWPDGLYSPGTTWHVADVVLPYTSFHTLCWHSESASLGTPILSGHAHVPPLPILACFLYISVSQVPHAAPCGTCMPVCTAGGRNDAQQSKSFPISWFSIPVSPSTHILLASAPHTAQQQPEGTNRLAGEN